MAWKSCPFESRLFVKSSNLHVQSARSVDPWRLDTGLILDGHVTHNSTRPALLSVAHAQRHSNFSNGHHAHVTMHSCAHDT